MTTSLEQREQQTNTGKAWTPILIGTMTDEQGASHVIRARYYEHGKIEEIDGEAWFLIEANAVNSFP